MTICRGPRVYKENKVHDEKKSARGRQGTYEGGYGKVRSKRPKGTWGEAISRFAA